MIVRCVSDFSVFGLKDGASRARVRFYKHGADFFQPLSPGIPYSVKVIDVDEVDQQVAHVRCGFHSRRAFLWRPNRRKAAVTDDWD